MPRRAQLVLALVLVLVLGPLAGAACGVDCLVATPHATRTATTQHDCKRALACCPSGAPAICSAAQTPEMLAAFLSTSSSAPDAPALTMASAEGLPQNPGNLSVQKFGSSPPIQSRAAIPIPIRI
ncbi:MAG TPA: hypothetical protein VF018_14785 [Acidobacteriaceae bacterium]